MLSMVPKISTLVTAFPLIALFSSSQTGYTDAEVMIMPQIRMRGVQAEKIAPVSKDLVDQLHAITGTAREHFTIELTHSTYILDGAVVPSIPFVEIAWFDRGQEVQDRVAQVVTAAMKQAGYPELDMVFTLMERSRYYENGQHF